MTADPDRARAKRIAVTILGVVGAAAVVAVLWLTVFSNQTTSGSCRVVDSYVGQLQQPQAVNGDEYTTPAGDFRLCFPGPAAAVDLRRSNQLWNWVVNLRHVLPGITLGPPSAVSVPVPRGDEYFPGITYVIIFRIKPGTENQAALGLNRESYRLVRHGRWWGSGVIANGLNLSASYGVSYVTSDHVYVVDASEAPAGLSVAIARSFSAPGLPGY